MLSRLRPRLTYANVVSTLCLFIVLGGTSYAVATGSIDSREIKNSTIRSKDIRNGQVTTSDVRNGSLLSRDFKQGQLPAGARGPQGGQGPQGSPGISGLQRVFGFSEKDSSGFKRVVARCPEGKRAIGGGADVNDALTGTPPNDLTSVVIDNIIPSEETKVPGVVNVDAVEEEPTAVSWSVTAYAVCANVS